MWDTVTVTCKATLVGALRLVLPAPVQDTAAGWCAALINRRETTWIAENYTQPLFYAGLFYAFFVSMSLANLHFFFICASSIFG